MAIQRPGCGPKGMSSVPLYLPRSHGQPCVKIRVNLFGRFISLFVGLPLQPSAIGKERNDSEGDEEHNAKDQHDTGVLSGPILSFDE